MTTYSYLRTSTKDQQNGIEVQRATIAARYPSTVEVVEHASGKNTTGRPGFTALLAQLRKGDTLVVAKLDRFARSVSDALTIMSDLHKRGIGFVCLDLDVDMSTPMGRLVFTILSAVAEFERGLISERTSAGLAVVKASGKRLGRESTIDVNQVVLLHASGYSVRRIATSVGASPAAVQRCLQRVGLGADAA